MREGGLILFVFGASGDLSRKKTFPSLWTLFRERKISRDAKIIAYARSDVTVSSLVNDFKPFCKKTEDDSLFEMFCRQIEYFKGLYDNSEDMKRLSDYVSSLENGVKVNKLFYLTLPPTVYLPVTLNIREFLFEDSEKFWCRIVIEKPFGTDLASSNVLSTHLKNLFPEESLYRIDHYLGKEMVQNLLVLRFANVIFDNLWNREFINCVLITLKEDFGTFGRGGYYDKSGVIRDILQNHTIQLLSLVAMDPPRSLDSVSIKDSKVNLLKCVMDIEDKNVILGQYVGDKATSPTDKKFVGYKDDPSVSPDSKTPTFVSLVCYIDNDRWRGVPFILKAGKALNERKGEIRIQFKSKGNSLFDENLSTKLPPNELVIKLQPTEAIYSKFQTKIPGLDFKLSTTELDISFDKRFDTSSNYDAYEKLILDVISGSHINFVRSDELQESWKIFDKLLERVEDGKLPLHQYVFGSRGPEEADKLAETVGFKFDGNYIWKTNA